MNCHRRRILLIWGMSALAVTAPGAQQTTRSPLEAETAAATAPKKGGVVSQGAATSWEMSDEERIARRVYRRRQLHPESASVPTHGYRESVDGRTNPELFMPYELYDHLLLALSSDKTLAARFHAKFDPRVKAFGYDENAFWNTLSSAALPYLRTREQHEKRRHRTTTFQLADGRESMVTINRDDCAARLESLDHARRLLGGRKFDHFLYSKIATTFQHSEGGSAPDRAAQLRYMARGCQ